MIPLIKVFSLCVKVFTRPVLNYVKDISVKQNKTFFKHKKLRNFFMGLGKKQFEWGEKLENRLVQRKRNEMFFIKKINDE